MTLITLAEAEQEFVESIAYYESRELRLGLRFRNVYDDASKSRFNKVVGRETLKDELREAAHH
jgi:hypothetical protein